MFEHSVKIKLKQLYNINWKKKNYKNQIYLTSSVKIIYLSVYIYMCVCVCVLMRLRLNPIFLTFSYQIVRNNHLVQSI